MRLKEGDEVVVSDLDFPAGVTPWLQETSGVTVRLWKARGGRLLLEDLQLLLSKKTRLVQVSLVSFYNGFRLNLPELIRLVQQHTPALVSVDVTQALGRIPLELAGADLIVSSTHKWILGVHGGGLVGVPAGRARELTSVAGGWFHLENAFGPGQFERAVSKPGAASYGVGMPNCAAIYANRAALQYIQSVGVAAIDRYAKPLVAACLQGLKRLPVELLTPDDPDALAGIIAFRHGKADAIHQHLHAKNIHLMSHAGRLRVSIHGYNTAADVDTFLRTLREASDAC
jgi:selenocysteine lyase/cysteine desulfurase